MNTKADQTFTSTGIPNLYRRGEVYYARTSSGRKRGWKSLHTTDRERAIALLLAMTAEQDRLREAIRAGANPHLTLEEASQTLVTRAMQDPDLADASKDLCEQTHRRLIRTAADFARKPVAKILDAEWSAWYQKLRTDPNLRQGPMRNRVGPIAPSTLNQTLAHAKRVLRYAVEQKAIHNSPFWRLGIKGKGERPKVIEMPTDGEFERLIAAMRSSGTGTRHDSADFAELLAYTGMRLKEAQYVIWSDVDMNKWTLRVRVSKTEAGERLIPLGADARDLLTRMHARGYDTEPYDNVTAVQEISRSLKGACRAAGIQHLTHHDFRRMYVTRCVEAGIDFTVIARWMGHSDNGVLLIHTYNKTRAQIGDLQVAKLSRLSTDAMLQKQPCRRRRRPINEQR